MVWAHTTWGLPQSKGTILGVTTRGIMTVVFWGLYSGRPIYGKLPYIYIYIYIYICMYICIDLHLYLTFKQALNRKPETSKPLSVTRLLLVCPSGGVWEGFGSVSLWEARGVLGG